LPEFRYFAEPHGPSSTWTEAARACDLCGEVRAGYEGPYYAADEIDFVCEPCLAGGRLAERDATTNEGAPSVADSARRGELEQRTPNLVTWQDWWWPAHCGDFCRFEREAGQKELVEVAPDGDGPAFLAAHLDPDDAPLEWDLVPPSLAGDEGFEVGVYLFRCVVCETPVVRWDAA